MIRRHERRRQHEDVAADTAEQAASDGLGVNARAHLLLGRELPYAQFNFLVDLGTGQTDGPEAGFQESVRTVTIQLQNEDHTAIVMTWKLIRARIVKHTSGPLNAQGTDVAIEELTLAYERLELE